MEVNLWSVSWKCRSGWCVTRCTLRHDAPGRCFLYDKMFCEARFRNAGDKSLGMRVENRDQAIHVHGKGKKKPSVEYSATYFCIRDTQLLSSLICVN